MATLIDAAEFTSNEVYQIQATDPVEGAASGASFSGTGISNQPHQQLANRTAFLKQRQDVNISNIGVLQAFMAAFAGAIGRNGYLKIPVADVNRGSIVAIVQWGSVFPGGGLVGDTSYTVTWPIAFPSACVWSMAALSNSRALVNTGKLIIDIVSFTTTTGVFRSDATGDADDGGQVPNDGFYWMAIGF
jgi:hypothetical protein